MRQINEAAQNLIEVFEGKSLTAYPDMAGYLTIGTGHLVRPGEDFSAGITEEQRIELLQSDLGVAERSVLRLIGVPLTDNQYGALVSFCFNLGGGALQTSTLRRKINRGDSIKGEFERWCFAGKPLRRSKGLLRRRQTEAALYNL